MAILFILTLFVAGAVLMIGEYVRRRLGLRNEVSRKLVHSIHAGLIAIWPFIIGYEVVIVMEILFILLVFVSRFLYKHRTKNKLIDQYLNAMYKVGRPSFGEFFFPLGVILAALLAESKWIYLAAVLNLGLADAAAAVVGKRFGKGNSYEIFGQAKSFAGSVAFLAASLLITGYILVASPGDFEGALLLVAVLLPVILTIAENIGVYGVDNLLIPLIAVVALNALV
jgi:phytol kinase